MEKISGQRGFTLSAEGLVDDLVTASTTTRAPQSVAAYMIAGTQLYFEFGVDNARYVGSAFITSLSASGGTDDAPVYSISLESTGALTFDEDVTS